MKWNLEIYMNVYELGNRGIIYPLTLVYSSCCADCSLSQQCIMNNAQNSETMVTINLKVSMCRDIKKGHYKNQRPMRMILKGRFF